MDYLLLFIIGTLSFLVLKKVSNVIKIPVILLLIAFGILFGSQGIWDLFGTIDSDGSSIALLSNYAIVILFLISGLGMNMKNIKKGGVKTLKLGTYPVLIESFVMATIAYIIFPLIGFDFPYSTYLLIAILFAMASPAIIMPLTMKLKQDGKKSSILDVLPGAVIVDNTIPLIFFVISVIITLSIGNGDSITFLGLTKSISISMISLVIAYGVGHLIGLLLAFLEKIQKLPIIAYSIITIFISLLMVKLLGTFGSSFGLMIGMGIGVGINFGIKDNKIKGLLLKNVSIIYGLIFAPIVFLYVGTKIQIETLTNMKLVVMLVIITILSIVIKGLISELVLKKYETSDEEINFTKTLMAAKGVAVINLSLAISPGFIAAGLDNQLDFMYVFAAVGILISFPYSIIMSDKNAKQIK